MVIEDNTVILIMIMLEVEGDMVANMVVGIRGTNGVKALGLILGH